MVLDAAASRSKAFLNVLDHRVSRLLVGEPGDHMVVLDLALLRNEHAASGAPLRWLFSMLAEIAKQRANHLLLQNALREPRTLL
jgi:hypothetical protein